MLTVHRDRPAAASQKGEKTNNTDAWREWLQQLLRALFSRHGLARPACLGRRRPLGQILLIHNFDSTQTFYPAPHFVVSPFFFTAPPAQQSSLYIPPRQWNPVQGAITPSLFFYFYIPPSIPCLPIRAGSACLIPTCAALEGRGHFRKRSQFRATARHGRASLPLPGRHPCAGTL